MHRHYVPEHLDNDNIYNYIYVNPRKHVSEQTEWRSQTADRIAHREWALEDKDLSTVPACLY